MEKIEFKSQICTTREQSERLLKLGLKKETADCALHFDCVDIDGEVHYMAYEIGHKCCGIPAWSLHRLLFLIPKEVNIDGFKFSLRSDVIMRLEDADYIYERLIGIIERVIEQGYFNKDYLENALHR